MGRKQSSYRIGRARAGAALLAACLAAWTAGAGAQDSGGTVNSGVTVNADILNNLDWAAAVAARRGFDSARALEPAGREGLLPPPADFPESRLLIRPERAARKAAQARAPLPPRKPGEMFDGEIVASEPTVAEALARLEPLTETLPRAAEVPALVPPEPPLPPPAPPSAPDAPDSPAPSVAAPSVAALPPPEPQREPPSRAPAPAEPQATPSGETEIAALPPPSEPLPRVRLSFDPGATDLGEAARARLAELARRLLAEPGRRIAVLAYAGLGEDQRASTARRLSLSRALAVRSFLADKGIVAARIDLRPLGDGSDSGPADRVDIVGASR